MTSQSRDPLHTLLYHYFHKGFVRNPNDSALHACTSLKQCNSFMSISHQMQDGHDQPITTSSWTLTSVERMYSQLEMDVNVYTVNPFEAGWYGAEFTSQIPFCLIKLSNSAEVYNEPLYIVYAVVTPSFLVDHVCKDEL